MMNRESLSDLTSCLQRELEHYQSLQQLCSKQKEIVDSSPELAGLAPLLQEKQHQIEKIKEIEKGLALSGDSWSEIASQEQGGELIGRIRRLGRKIRVLLKQIVSLEQETQRSLLQRRLMMKARLQQLRCWRRMLRKYAPTTNRVPRFVDTRG